MTHPNAPKIILWLSVLTAILILIASTSGLISPAIYEKETFNWKIQSIGQDYVNLFLILPCQLVSSIFFFKGKHTASFLWAGSTVYLIYTYLIYCFDIHFNSFFLIYCLILGLNFYSLLYFIYTYIRDIPQQTITSTLRKLSAYYFLTIAILFYFLWLSEIIPAHLNQTLPKSLMETTLPTNAVHVIDLSVLLPGIFITGILLLKKHQLAIFLTPTLLTFFILMNITIATLIILMKKQGLETGLSVAYGMGALTLFSLVLLIIHLRNVRLSL